MARSVVVHARRRPARPLAQGHSRANSGQSLREREARFRATFERAAVGIAHVGLDGRWLRVNDRLCAIVGCSRDELLATSVRQITHDPDLKQDLEAVQRLLTGETDSFSIEKRYVRGDGSLVWIQLTVALMRDTRGEPDVFIAVIEDINARKAAELALDESDARLQLALDLAQLGSWDFEVATGKMIGSPVYRSLLGFGPGATLDQESIVGRVHPDDQQAGRTAMTNAIATNGIYSNEFRLVRPDGSVRWIASIGLPLGVDETPERVVGVARDVTLFREALEAVKDRDRLIGALEAALSAVRESEARLRRLFDANVFGVIFWEVDGPITSANDAFLAMIGADRALLDGGRVDWRSITPPEWSDADDHALNEIRSSGSCTPYEKVYRRLDGETVPVLIASTIFPDTDEGIGLVFDLTEQKRQERFEQEFLAGIAHDIKNPLAAMKAQAQLMRRRLRSGKLSLEIAEEGLAAVDGNVNRVSKRLDELMDIALLRAGNALDLAREPVDLVELTAARAETYRQTTERHQIVVLIKDRPLIGMWDANRIERVVDNLFSNAIKYSPNGGVVQVELRRDGAWAVLTITDEGFGIPAADLPNIFTRFARGSNVQGRVQGAGIGLAGVRMLVEQHGGTAQVESVEGEGSTFTLRLPLTW